MKAVVLTDFGTDPVFWHLGQSPEDDLIEHVSDRMSDNNLFDDDLPLETFLAEQGLTFGEEELEAFILDELFRGGTDPMGVLYRLEKIRAQHLEEQDDDRERLIHEIEMMWEMIADGYNRFSDQRAGRCRREGLEILDGLILWMLEREDYLGDRMIPEKELLAISGLMAVLTEMVISLNDSELSLEEAETVQTSIRQISRRIQQTQDEIKSNDVQKGDRSGFRVLEGGRGRALQVYQVLVTLVEPANTRAWRRLLVRGDVNLAELSHIVSTAMNYKPDQLHAIRLGDLCFSDTNSPHIIPLGLYEESERLLNQLVEEAGTEMILEYDLANVKRHTLRIEAIHEPQPDQVLPTCLGGDGKPGRGRKKVDLEAINQKLAGL